MDELDFSSVHELKIQSLDSTVRDIAYNTTIPSSLSATIAIAAQAPDSIDNLDAVTFAAINKGIRDRFAIDTTAKSDYDILFGGVGETEQRTLWDQEFDKNLLAVFEALYIFDHDSWSEVLGETAERYTWWETIGSVIAPVPGSIVAASKLTKNLNRNFGGVLRDLLYYNYTLNDNQYLREEAQPSIQSEDAAKFSGSLKSLNKAISYFQRVYGSNASDGSYYRGQPYDGATRRLSSIIPLKFNAKLDGLSGIVIVNVFKLPKNRLPIAYNGDDIHFIVMGEEQTITSGQDWTTTITGQITLLGDPSTKGGSKHQEWKDSWKNVDVVIDSDISIRSYSPRGNEYEFNNDFGDYVDYDLEYSHLLDPLHSMNITSPFGPRDLDGDGNYDDHNGIDLSTKFNNGWFSKHDKGDTDKAKVIYAVWDGVITEATMDDGGACGGRIDLAFNGTLAKSDPNPNRKNKNLVPQFPIPNEKGRSQATPRHARYCHLSELAPGIIKGATVYKGQVLGKSGGDISQPGRGNSSVQHLHFALLKGAGGNKDFISPAPWLPDNNDSWWTNVWQGDWWYNIWSPSPEVIEERKNRIKDSSGATGAPATNGGAGSWGNPMPSDARLKTNLVKVGDKEEGVPLYEFNFRNVPIKSIDLNTTSRFRGVLAQDLLETDAADAVSINDTGFYEVDYNLLSINFAKLS